VRHVLALEEISTRDEADLVAFQMMETYEADHFRHLSMLALSHFHDGITNLL